MQPKYFNNDANFEFGFRTANDSWENRWRTGQNQYLGWIPLGGGVGGLGSGSGAKTMGEELANSGAFARCQVRKVFKAVCLREPDLGDPLDPSDRTQFDSMVANFRLGYSMKQTFAEAAVHCMGQ